MKVLLAMSGGVDSSVAGALLLDAGHEVVGVTMRLWGGDSDTGCCSVSDVDDARRVAQQLDIDHVVFNFGEDFDRHVVGPYVSDHAAGRTPNPCIECNRHLKFDRLAARAAQLGFEAVATGHHARLLTGDDKSPRLARGVDRDKDQSYVVHVLPRDELARTLFPVGHLTKDQVRAHAVALGLRTATKPDSQDVCFITSTGGREAFLGRRIPVRRGRVLDTSGAPLGEVPAIELVTLGQRRGLGLAGGGPKRYVVDVDVDRGTVVVGGPEDLTSDLVSVDQLGWLGPVPAVGDEVLVQCSAHGAPRRAVVTALDRARATGVLRWIRPEHRVAPGQSVVLYDLGDEVVLGGGTAVRTDRHDVPTESRSDVPPRSGTPDRPSADRQSALPGDAQQPSRP